jgi:hypothetical protein
MELKQAGTFIKNKDKLKMKLTDHKRNSYFGRKG